MRVIVLYHQRSEQEGLIHDFTRDYARSKGKKLELVSLESIEGVNYARLYDITRYPAFLAISDNGGLQRLWQGDPLPLMDELAYYTQDQNVHDYGNTIAHRLKILQPLAA